MTTAMLPVLTALPAHAWGPGYGPGWFFLFPLFWILLIGLIILLARRMHWRGRRQDGMLGAEGVLRERYARGEIDETEYRQRLEVLRSNRK